MNQKSSTNVGRESDDRVVPAKCSNKDGGLSEELRRRWHQTVEELGQWLRSVVQGYFNYHAVNLTSLKSFRLEVSKRWLRALRRRGQKHPMTWARLGPLIERWLPIPKILHPYPNLRFDAKYLR